MPHDTSYDDQHPDDVPPPVPLEQCFVFFDGKLRANANGRKRFGERFARAGFDIDRITTLDELQAALEGSWHIVWGDVELALERRYAGKTSIEHQLFRAVYRSNDEEAQRLRRKLERIRRLGLRLVDAPDAPDDDMPPKA